MDNVFKPVIIVTLFLLVYVIVAAMGLYFLTSLLFIISPFALIWMVYSVLKNGKPSDKKFEDVFYEDYPYQREKGGDS